MSGLQRFSLWLVKSNHIPRQAAVRLGCLLQGLFGGELLVVGAAGDDCLARAAFFAHVHQRPAFRLVAELVAHQGQAVERLGHFACRHLAPRYAHFRAVVFDHLLQCVENQLVGWAQLVARQVGD